MKLTKKILLALFIGAIFGLALNLFVPQIFPTIDQYLFTPLGKIFLNLINMLVIPIVFSQFRLEQLALVTPKN